ncbi:MAG: DUF5058 family protein [Clostridiales bacterium]|jgi:hypothetical protein|nr:DUF5058 family protein [Clostridiales bacterium]
MNLNAGTIYLIVGTVIAAVLMQAVVFLIRAYKEGVRIGMSREVLNKTITSSAVFSAMPSLGILVTMFGLIKFLGIPFSWLRLSVIGSLMYEITAANTAAEAAAGASLSNAEITPEVFVTIAVVMSVGIILGGILCIAGLKKYSALIKNKTTEKGETGDAEAGKLGAEAEKNSKNGSSGGMGTSGSAAGTEADAPKKKKKINVAEMGNLVSASIFIALCAAYVGGAVGEAFGGFHIDAYTSVVPFVCMLIAVACMAVLTKLQVKRTWIQSFSLSFSMLAGMISAVPVSLILGVMF